MIRFGWWALTVGYGPADFVRRQPDRSLAAEMTRRRIDEPMQAVITQFLAGVLAEEDMSTSRRFAEFVIRSFVRGTPGLPAGGIQAIPEQLAADLPDCVLKLHTRVHAVAGRTVRTDGCSVSADAVIVAADPRSAARLLGRSEPAMRWFTTYYHQITEAPKRASWLHIDLARNGPLVNTAAVSQVQPTYADHGTLIASTTLGRHDDSLEPQVRRHAAQLLDTSRGQWQLVARYPVEALPVHPPGRSLRRSVMIGDGLFVAGDHRDSPSIQGALVSGRRAAEEVLATAWPRRC